MTVQVLSLAPIVAALRAAQIYREVGDAAGLEAASRDIRNPPAAYVLPGRETAQASGFTAGLRRTAVTAQFMVISVARDIRPGAGAPVLSELETIRGGLIATLSALQPTYADGPIEHASGQLITGALPGGMLGWQDTFTLRFRRTITGI